MNTGLGQGGQQPLEPPVDEVLGEVVDRMRETQATLQDILGENKGTRDTPSIRQALGVLPLVSEANTLSISLYQMGGRIRTMVGHLL